ncbi:MAG: acetoin utilization protein AcuC [Geodermatophilaceae bacterium]|nr:acetoin utilization protein AcuC [Geodermatophilaceae bacterium]
MSDAVAVIWDDAMLEYDLGGNHPLHPIRLELTIALAQTLGVFQTPTITRLPPIAADEDLLRLIHTPGYISAVKRAPKDPYGAGHGMGTPDNPIFDRMHEASSLIAGGSIQAADWIWNGKGDHAANIAGGLHHAMADRASGFCVYNDPALAISWLLGQGAQRIAYVDVDVHHGDGVQAAFYEDPRVLTISLHQSPLSLFPGTGFPEETGRGEGVGSAINVALPPRTDDSGWLRAFHSIVPSALRAFAPEVLVSQCGCDAHRDDPLADLALSIDGQRASYIAMHDLAHEVCGGKWLVLGGGGYGLVRCVPRAWTHLLGIVGGTPVDPQTTIPTEWLEDIRKRKLRAIPPTRMTEDEPAEYSPWDPGGAEAVDVAIQRTRRATFPLLGLDPDDPRD